MSFDPQNPRGAPRPPTPPSSVPPQPLDPRQGPSRNVLLAVGIVAGLILLAILLLLLNLTGKPATSPAPLATTHGSAAPTIAGSPHASSAPSTTRPTSGATLAPTPIGSQSAGYDAFVAHIPEALRPNCVPATSPDNAVMFSASCTSSGGIALNYEQFTDVATMNGTYNQLVAQAQIDPNSGSCEDNTTWPAESTYAIAGAQVGRRLCTDRPGTPTIYWTDERLNILSTASGADAAGLVAFWTNEAGPVP